MAFLVEYLVKASKRGPSICERLFPVHQRLMLSFLCVSRMSMEVEGSLVITQVDEDDDAKYQCLAKNVVGTRGSEKAQLSVLGNDSFNL